MNKIMPRVFVCQEPMRKRGERAERRVDLSPATRFGDLVFVVKWSDTRNIDGTADRLVWQIRRALRTFTEHDYIIPIGDPTVIKLVGIIAAEISGGRYKVLQWDNKGMKYDVVQVDINCQPLEGMAP